MDAVDKWWELKKMEALALDGTDMTDMQVCKNHMISELRNAVDVVILEANDEERARMPI